MGLGQLHAIFPLTSSLHIVLPFGKMYTNIMTVISWGTVDASSDESLCQNWMKLDKSLQMPYSTQQGIHELLKGLHDDDNEYRDLQTGSKSEEDDNMDESDEEDIKPFAASIDENGLHRKPLNILKTLSVVNLPGVVDNLPLVFAPPSCIPYLVDEMITLKTPRVRFCRQSLLDGCLKGTTGVSSWMDNSDVLEKELNRVSEELHALEESQNRCIRQVERSRVESAKLMQQSASIRLSMFTRRVRHRHNMVAIGPVTGLLPPPLPTNEAAASIVAIQPKREYEEKGQEEADVAAAQKKPSRANGGKDDLSLSDAKSSYAKQAVLKEDSAPKKRSREERALELIIEEDKKSQDSGSVASKKPKRSGTRY